MLLKKTSVALYDAMSLLVLATFLLMLSPTPAFAYVDPSVMTYTIQALAGVAVALSTVLGVALRKTRKKLLHILNIDENAGKEIDPVWARIGEGGITREEYAALLAKLGRRKSLTKKKGDDLDYRKKGDAPSWARRFVLSVVTLAFCGFTLGIVAPFEMVAGSKKDLLFSLGDIWWIMAIVVALVVLVASLLVSMVRGKAFTLVIVFLFSGGLCCYLQAMFLNVGLPVADGDTIDFWSDHMTMIVVSTIVWLVVLIVPALACRVNRTRAQALVLFFSLCLIAVQGVGVGSLFIASSTSAENDQMYEFEITEDGLYEVSGKDNVIVFVLDYFDTRLMNQLMEENVEITEKLSGFTYFDNNAGVMIPTPYALPYFITGEEPAPGESISEFHDNRYKRSTFLSDIKEQNYSIGLYSNNFGLQYLSDKDAYERVASNTINMHPVGESTIDELGAVSALTKCALYRDMPWILKWRFWFYTDEVNQKVISYSSDDAPENTPYVLNDPKYYQRLERNGLTIEDGNYNGAFRLIHLNGPHFPFNMNENAEDVGMDNSTVEQQAIGSLKIVENYLQKMKDLGVYEEATIIITSDHGSWVSSTELPTDVSSPMLLVKRPNSVESIDRPMLVDHSPVSFSDFNSTILSFVGVDENNTGNTFFDALDDDRIRTMYMIEALDGRITSLLKYEINGDVLDFANWEYTGEEWIVDEF